MIYLLTKRIISASYQPALLAATLNILFFFVLSREKILPANGGEVSMIFLLFLIENCLFAFWLLWSPSQRHL